MRKRLSSIVAILCAASALAAGPEITLEDFCARVLACYPRFKAQGEAVEVALARQLQARAGYLPGLQALAGATYGDDQVYVFGALLRQRAFTRDDFEVDRLNNPDARANFEFGLRAEVPLFNAFQTIARVRQSARMVEAARYDREFSRMEALLIAADAYLGALAVEEVLAKEEEVCRESESDIRQAEELKDKGAVLGADFYAARVILGSLKSGRNALAGRKKGMHALMNILMGEDPLKPLKLAGRVERDIPSGPGLEAWLEEAGRQRPDLRALDEAIRAQEELLAGERRRAWPVVNAFADVRENTENFRTGGASFGVGVVGRLDLFAPEYSPRVKAAEKSLRKLRYDRDAAGDAVARDIAFEHARFEAIRENISVLRSMADDSDRAVEMAKPLYHEGRKSVADLLDMRQGSVKTWEAYRSAVANLSTSAARMLFLSGQMDEARLRTALEGGGK